MLHPSLYGVRGLPLVDTVCLLVPGRAECSGAVVDGFRPRRVASSAWVLSILGLKLFLAFCFRCSCRGLAVGNHLAEG